MLESQQFSLAGSKALTVSQSDEMFRALTEREIWEVVAANTPFSFPIYYPLPLPIWKITISGEVENVLTIAVIGAVIGAVLGAGVGGVGALPGAVIAGIGGGLMACHYEWDYLF